ncbi:MAG: hypothetical protein V4733_09170 [Verrucomicrobiota bacterium]
MKSPLVLGSICFFFSIFLFVPLPKGKGYPFPSSAEIVISILYLPVTLLAVATIIVAIYKIILKINRGPWVFAMILSMPVFVPTAQGFIATFRRAKFVEWPREAMELRELALDYQDVHPERFHRMGKDEEVRLDGFGKHIESLRSAGDAKVAAMHLPVRGDLILDTWGNPVRYGFDFDQDGYIEISSRMIAASYASGQTAGYRIAIAVALGRSKHHSDFYPHVGSR